MFSKRGEKLYTRTFQKSEAEKMNIPQNYDGIAFSEPEFPPPLLGEVSNETPPSAETTDRASVPTVSDKGKTDGSFLGGLFKNIPFLSSSRFGGKFPDKLGTEDLLIIGVALFLLFTKNGDRECAIMLLLLLFVN